jgi:hypothetical protein
MSNLEITNNNPFGIVVWEPVFEDNTLVATGAVVWPAGTLLGRITASGKLTAYVSGAGDGSEVPIAVLTDSVEFTGAADMAYRPLITGRVRRVDLVAFGVGALTQAEVDALRDYGIVAQKTTQLAELDNQ